MTPGETIITKSSRIIYFQQVIFVVTLKFCSSFQFLFNSCKWCKYRNTLWTSLRLNIGTELLARNFMKLVNWKKKTKKNPILLTCFCLPSSFTAWFVRKHWAFVQSFKKFQNVVFVLCAWLSKNDEPYATSIYNYHS